MFNILLFEHVFVERKSLKPYSELR